MTISDRSSEFRLRGLDMTRIETFTDAAFASALTRALLHVPGFVLSAALLMVFWNGHHRWSRHYGLTTVRPSF